MKQIFSPRAATFCAELRLSIKRYSVFLFYSLFLFVTASTNYCSAASDEPIKIYNSDMLPTNVDLDKAVNYFATSGFDNSVGVAIRITNDEGCWEMVNLSSGGNYYLAVRWQPNENSRALATIDANGIQYLEGADDSGHVGSSAEGRGVLSDLESIHRRRYASLSAFADIFNASAYGPRMSVTQTPHGPRTWIDWPRVHPPAQNRQTMFDNFRFFSRPERKKFDAMGSGGFARYFTIDGPSIFDGTNRWRELILQQYNMYQFEGFRDYVRGFGSLYDNFMLYLEEIIHGSRDCDLREELKDVQGFKYSWRPLKRNHYGFHRFVKHEAHLVRERRKGEEQAAFESLLKQQKLKIQKAEAQLQAQVNDIVQSRVARGEGVASPCPDARGDEKNVGDSSKQDQSLEQGGVGAINEESFDDSLSWKLSDWGDFEAGENSRGQLVSEFEYVAAHTENNRTRILSVFGKKLLDSTDDKLDAELFDNLEERLMDARHLADTLLRADQLSPVKINAQSVAFFGKDIESFDKITNDFIERSIINLINETSDSLSSLPSDQYMSDFQFHIADAIVSSKNSLIHQAVAHNNADNIEGAFERIVTGRGLKKLACEAGKFTKGLLLGGVDSVCGTAKLTWSIVKGTCKGLWYVVTSVGTPDKNADLWLHMSRLSPMERARFIIENREQIDAALATRQKMVQEVGDAILEGVGATKDAIVCAYEAFYDLVPILFPPDFDDLDTLTQDTHLLHLEWHKYMERNKQHQIEFDPEKAGHLVGSLFTDLKSFKLLGRAAKACCSLMAETKNGAILSRAKTALAAIERGSSLEAALPEGVALCAAELEQITEIVRAGEKYGVKAASEAISLVEKQAAVLTAEEIASSVARRAALAATEVGKSALEALEALGKSPAGTACFGGLAKAEEILLQAYERFQSVEGFSEVINRIKRTNDLATGGNIRGVLYELECALRLEKKGEEVVKFGCKVTANNTFDFDIITKSKAIECKNLNWATQKLGDLQSQLGEKQKVALEELGKVFELHSRNQIAEELKQWLTKRGIPFKEGL